MGRWKVVGPSDVGGLTFHDWMARYASVPADKRAPSDDPDGDGVLHLLERLFALDPAEPEPEEAPHLELHEESWTVRFRQSATLPSGVSYVLQYLDVRDHGEWRLLPGVTFRPIE